MFPSILAPFPSLPPLVLGLHVEPTKACGIFLLSWFVCIPPGATHSQNYGCDGNNNCEKCLGNEVPAPDPIQAISLPAVKGVILLSRIDLSPPLTNGREPEWERKGRLLLGKPIKQKAHFEKLTMLKGVFFFCPRRGRDLVFLHPSGRINSTLS